MGIRVFISGNSGNKEVRKIINAQWSQGGQKKYCTVAARGAIFYFEILTSFD